MTRALALTLMAAEHLARLDADLVDMQFAAAIAGQHYDTFRKDKPKSGWRYMVRERGFPAPVQEGPYLWRRAPLLAWQKRQEEAIAARLRGVSPANQNTPAAPPARGRADAQRRRMMERMGR